VTTNSDYEGRLEVPLNQLVVQEGAPLIFHHVWRLGGRYGFAPSMVRTLRNTMATYDLVHIHWLYNFSCIAAARAALGAGVPFVIQPHGSLDPHMRKRNRIVKEVYMATVGRPLLPRAAAVVFDTPEEGRLASYSPRRPEWIMAAGIDSADFAQLPPRGTFRAAFPAVDGPFLLFLSRLSPQKGLDLLLPAFERIARVRKDLWLVVAGPDYRGHESEVRALARQLGIEHRVLFTGMLTHDMKLAAFADAELFVLPSYSENFGAVITEALLCGLPVVISGRVNIHQELSAAGVATVVPCEIDGVAAGIESAFADTGLRQRISAVGPAFVRGHYTWDAIVPTLVQRYTDVIAAYR
jgi:glycosyltransferase involved in cell wall biosynthesis